MMKTILVIGASGQLAQALAEIPHQPHQTLARPLPELTARGRPHLDILQSDNVRQVIDDIGPDGIVNAAAYTAVDKAESEPKAAKALNVDAVANLAEICAANGLPLIHISTDYVSDGGASRNPMRKMTRSRQPASTAARSLPGWERRWKNPSMENTCWISQNAAKMTAIDLARNERRYSNLNAAKRSQLEERSRPDCGSFRCRQVP